MQGWTPDTEFWKANCCLGWGTISFTHFCNFSTWVVSSPLSPKHHIICLVLILTNSNSLMWRMCTGGKFVYSSLIDQFQFCSYLPVLLTLFLRENNYTESGFSRGVLWFMWGTKTYHIRRVKSGGGKKCSFPARNKSRASTLQEYTVM